MSLRDKVVAEITTVNPITNEYIYTDLILPASVSEIEDALQKARITDQYHDMADISIINCPYLPELADTRIDGVSIKELNLFAKRVTILPDNEVIALNGIFLNQKSQGKYENGIPMKDLINLTYGLDDVTVIRGISTDAQIGDFVINNDLNEDIVKMSDEAVRFLDIAAVGKQHRESECGEFVANCYVLTATYKFPQEYKGTTKERLKIDNTIVFELDIAEAPVNDSTETAGTAETIYLPMPKNEANRVAKLHNEECIEDCVYYDFKSAIAGIDDQIFTDMLDFDKLNDIAERYVSYSQPDRVKFKAAIESDQPKNLDEVTDIAKNLHRYNLSYYANAPEAFAEEYLSYHLPTGFDMDLFDFPELNRLGNRLADRLGASFTEYGVISARDKGLYDTIEYSNEEKIKQAEEMGEMTL